MRVRACARRVGQKVAGWLVGLGTAAFVLAYQWLVDPAPPGSTAVKVFAALANGARLALLCLGKGGRVWWLRVDGRAARRERALCPSLPLRAGPLRGMMLGFYSGASDFTRRLTSVRANAKFSAPDAGDSGALKGSKGVGCMFGVQGHESTARRCRVRGRRAGRAVGGQARGAGRGGGGAAAAVGPAVRLLLARAARLLGRHHAHGARGACGWMGGRVGVRCSGCTRAAAALWRHGDLFLCRARAPPVCVRAADGAVWFDHCVRAPHAGRARGGALHGLEPRRAGRCVGGWGCAQGAAHALPLSLTTRCCCCVGVGCEQAWACCWTPSPCTLPCTSTLRRAAWTASRWTARRAWGWWAVRWAAGPRSRASSRAHWRTLSRSTLTATTPSTACATRLRTCTGAGRASCLGTCRLPPLAPFLTSLGPAFLALLLPLLLALSGCARRPWRAPATTFTRGTRPPRSRTWRPAPTTRCAPGKDGDPGGGRGHALQFGCCAALSLGLTSAWPPAACCSAGERRCSCRRWCSRTGTCSSPSTRPRACTPSPGAAPWWWEGGQRGSSRPRPVACVGG